MGDRVLITVRRRPASSPRGSCIHRHPAIESNCRRKKTALSGRSAASSGVISPVMHNYTPPGSAVKGGRRRRAGRGYLHHQGQARPGKPPTPPGLPWLVRPRSGRWPVSGIQGRAGCTDTPSRRPCGCGRACLWCRLTSMPLTGRRCFSLGVVGNHRVRDPHAERKILSRHRANRYPDSR